MGFSKCRLKLLFPACDRIWLFRIEKPSLEISKLFMEEIILASQSPRRLELLRLLFKHFIVQGAELEEIRRFRETAADFVVRMAIEKAEAAGDSLLERTDLSLVVLAADTTVVDQDDILGKPAGPEQAKSMLHRLQGKEHQVLSGIAVFFPTDGSVLTDLARSDVEIRDLSQKEIDSYVASEDPLDKAGAYAIQNSDYQLVAGFQGCFANVMGLPLCHLKRMLDKVGVSTLDDVPERCQQALDYSCPVYEAVLYS